MSNHINKNAIRPLLVYFIQFKGIMAQHQLSDKTSSAEKMMTNKNVSTDFTCPGNKKKTLFHLLQPIFFYFTPPKGSKNNITAEVILMSIDVCA